MDIALNRTLHIYNVTQDIDITTGIEENSVSLSQILVSEETIVLGSYNSSKFEATVYDNPISIGDRIQVYFETHGISAVVGEAVAGISIVGTPDDGDSRKYLFTGKVESAKSDTLVNGKHIVAYDDLYWVKDVDVTDWIKSFKTTLDSYDRFSVAWLRSKMCDFVGIEEEPYEYPHSLISSVPDNPLYEYTFIFGSHFIKYFPETPISFSQLLRYMCELHTVFPHMNGQGKLEYIDIQQGADHFRINDYEKGTSEIEDNWTTYVDTIAISVDGKVVEKYISENHPPRVVYTLVDNPFLREEHPFYGPQWSSLQDITRLEFAEALFRYTARPSPIWRYYPATVHMIYSDLDIRLGDTIYVSTMYRWVPVLNMELSGPLLVEQTISAQGGYSDYSDNSSSASGSGMSYDNRQTYDAILRKCSLVTNTSSGWSNSVNLQGSQNVYTGINTFTLPKGTWLILISFNYTQTTVAAVGKLTVRLKCGTTVTASTTESPNSVGGAYSGQLVCIYTASSDITCAVEATLTSGNINISMKPTYIGQS